ncbi:MAG TPA: hypothetical protein DCQ98_03445 [Planctomycetaceae bacterium]|nr:hypothetical protein [Planctomycetaceae bacterium]
MLESELRQLVQVGSGHRHFGRAAGSGAAGEERIETCRRQLQRRGKRDGNEQQQQRDARRSETGIHRRLTGSVERTGSALFMPYRAADRSDPIAATGRAGAALCDLRGERAVRSDRDRRRPRRPAIAKRAGVRTGRLRGEPKRLGGTSVRQRVAASLFERSRSDLVRPGPLHHDPTGRRSEVGIAVERTGAIDRTSDRPVGGRREPPGRSVSGTRSDPIVING